MLATLLLGACSSSANNHPAPQRVPITTTTHLGPTGNPIPARSSYQGATGPSGYNPPNVDGVITGQGPSGPPGPIGASK